jgi:hypothetical protein
MAPEDFDPQHLTADASINRLVIAEVPGVPVRLAGQQAHTILSAEAVATVAAGHGIAVDREAIADDLGAALLAPDSGERSAALAVAAEVGLRLACLLSTLREPGTATAQGWNAWRRSYLRHWAAVEEVHLAGGLLAGGAGPVVADETSAALARLGVRTRTALMPSPAWSGLIGAARRLGLEVGEVMAVDLGGSRVKTALVRALPGGVVEVTVLTTSRVPFDAHGRPSSEALGDFLVGILDTAAHDARRTGMSVRALAVSVACYLEGGRRCADRSLYANLPDLGDSNWRRHLRDLFGRSVDVAVVHDGTAAAAAVPRRGTLPGAVLVLGTALGVGFPPIGLPAWRVPVVRPPLLRGRQPPA